MDVKKIMIIVLAGVFALYAGRSLDSITAGLARGVNLGNALEAPNFEGEWGYEIEFAHLDSIAAAGFTAIRLPVRWDTRVTVVDGQIRIDSAFMQRVEAVTDSALARGLSVIIDMHHYEALFESPAQHRDTLYGIWSFLSQQFTSYSDSVVIELLNEPHGNLSPEIWNTYAADLTDTVRKYNPHKAIMIGTADFGGLSGLRALDPPGDDNIIISVHYYEPFQFTHQGAEWVGDHADDWLGTVWKGIHPEKAQIFSHINSILRFSQKHDVPVHIGEFGSYGKAPHESRLRWTEFCARAFEDAGIPWTYWEFGAGFGIYDPAADRWNQDLAKALLSRDTAVLDMDEGVYGTNQVVNGTFADTLSAWTAGVWSDSARATLSVVDERFRAEVAAVGDAAWKVQLTQGGINLDSGRTYVISFDAVSPTLSTLSSVLQDPANDYSTATSATHLLHTDTARYYQIFTANASYENLTLTFNLGADTGTIFLDNIALRPVLDESESIVAADFSGSGDAPMSLSVSGRILNVVGAPFGKDLKIYNWQGRRLFRLTPRRGDGPSYSLPANLCAGMYVFRIGGRSASVHIR
ncbi:MAG: cellulase family glycosylhydrolase [Fibrobacterota bacterium]